MNAVDKIDAMAFEKAVNITDFKAQSQELINEVQDPNASQQQ